MKENPHQISVFGLGYVGSVTAGCFAQMGHKVIGVDVNPAKVEMLESGHSPVVEAELGNLVAAGRKACQLHATSDAIQAVCESEVSFICVGTPSLGNGKLDLRYVEQVCNEIGQGLARKGSSHVVVLRSTVLPGTTEQIAQPALEQSSGKRAGVGFHLCYNPEFMREGTAVEDFFHPPYTVLGAEEPQPLDFLRELYQWSPTRIFETTLADAEMVKYMSNAFHAVKVGFANEMGTLAKHLGVNTQKVAEIFLSDTKLNISDRYLAPGFAFGGSCLPKDLRALQHRARELDLKLPLLESVLPSNAEHISRAVDMVLRSSKRKVALLGLSFKAGTDDLRESPHVQLVKRLLGEGCQIKIWDSVVSLGRLVGTNRQFIEDEIPHISSLLSTDLKDVIGTSEIVVIGTRSVEEQELNACLQPDQIVVDLVNLEKEHQINATPSYEGICW
ncbi:MAG TPA: UDP-glucose/GDP-mannose dehydrogenase family protein [Terriglobia bacterium]|nr:UDP-glucose/GDP-mannose dehydrogenase family protein [Terriglobia bacterium]